MHGYRAKAVLFLLGGVLALGLVALAWAIGPGSSEAQQDAMYNCPQAGKWAISVWDGDDSTDSGQALATCDAVRVDFAYYIDPDTQGWSRWFAGRADISNLLTLNNMQGVLAYGAVSAPPPSPAPSPTPSPTPTPTGQYSFTFPSFYGEPDTFRGTVEEIRIMDSIPGAGFYTGTVTPPVGGQFAVVLMTVTNIGSEAVYVGSFSFTLRDDQDRVFTLELTGPMEQNAAEAYFDRAGIYDIIMPGITLDMVFVFLVPEGTTGLVAERYATDGW